MMKKSFKLFALLCTLLFSVQAYHLHAQETAFGDQAAAKERDFYFVYIDHEPDTIVHHLINKLDQWHQAALDYGNILVVYLANGDEPLVSFTNLKDPKPELQRDNDLAYETICAELQSRPFHEPTNADLSNILEIIGPAGAYPLFNNKDQDDPMLYRSIKIRFFVGRQFWWRTLNEDIIAMLFQSLGLNDYMLLYKKTQLGYEIWRNKDLPLPNEEFGQPRFGSHNYGKINNMEKVQIIPYP